MSNDPEANPEKAKDFADRLKKYVEEGKAINQSRNEYKKVPGLTRAGEGGYGGADLERGMMGSRMPKPKLKAGGMVSSASKRADGCAVKGKTKGKVL
jgi:hypothetical protein